MRRLHKAKSFASVAEAVAWYADLGYETVSHNGQTRTMLRFETTIITGRVVIEHTDVLIAIAYETEWI